MLSTGCRYLFLHLYYCKTLKLTQVEFTFRMKSRLSAAPIGVRMHMNLTTSQYKSHQRQFFLFFFQPTPVTFTSTKPNSLTYCTLHHSSKGFQKDSMKLKPQRFRILETIGTILSLTRTLYTLLYLIF